MWHNTDHTSHLLGRDVVCTFGHHCKYGDGCYMDACYFADTHGEDLTPAKKMYEDGTEEWLQSYLQKVSPLRPDKLPA